MSDERKNPWEFIRESTGVDYLKNARRAESENENTIYDLSDYLFSRTSAVVFAMFLVIVGIGLFFAVGGPEIALGSIFIGAGIIIMILTAIIKSK